jgi:site-specific DNA recombinase
VIAAIYARKSTDQNLPDEEKSVTRQVEHATAYAQRKGWTVAPEHVYQDDGISGAEFVKRPGFLALMNALRPRPPFQVLIVMEQSRLGRSLDEVPYALKRITDAGVRVYCYLTDNEVKRESAADKFMIHAIAFVDDMAREQARERTRDALRRKVERGHVAGGLVYGYRNVRGEGHVTRTIVIEEAEVLRRIFREISAGAGYLKVAQGLNAGGIPGPRGRGPWAASTIRAMIFNPLYRGELVWGRTRWADQGGTKRKLDVADTSTWVTVPAPTLRIIDEGLWKATHERLAQGRAVYMARTNGQTWGRPLNPTESKYLLTGLLRCGHCGGGVHVSRQSGRRGEGLWLYYVCARQRTRGIPCPGALRVRSSVVDEAVLEDLGGKLMAPERITAAIRRAAARLTAKPDAGRGRRSRLKGELRGLEQEIGRYAEAIATAGPLPSLLDALQGRERRRMALAGELGQLDALERTAAVVDDVAVTAELRALCAEWRALLEEDPPIAQQIVRRMLTDRLTVERTPQGIRLRGMATFGPLVANIVLRGEMVPPGEPDQARLPFEGLLRAA